MTGRTLSHYQILEPLGSGGMGEVFKARDTRLNRLVAIKILRPERVSEDSRKQRFIQEAQAASALNHPNIVTIHDIGSQDGVDFMVMEYVAGATLDARIPRQGMRLGEALRVAVQFAEGLRRAHAAGIVHRDLKPSNIMVADEGVVKILDFGLAKLTEKAEIGADEATRTARLETEEGTILGTTAYMSPEQAEGRKLDARTDIFSFGVVLYEMLTGRKAFVGDTRVSTMSAILKEEPKPVDNIPSDLDKIIRRCLRKDRDRRFQHMDDLRVALLEVKEDTESGASSPVVKLGSSRRWPWVVAGVGLLGAVAAGIVWKGRETPPASYALRQITADTGLTTTPAISPDGRLIAYASDRATGKNLDIWVHPLTENAQPIRLTTHDADDRNPSFSADGGQIAFYSRRDGGGIYVVPALGGQERLLVRGADLPRYSPDGRWLAYSSTGGSALQDSQVFVMPATGGAPRRVGAEIGWASYPLWSPDSQSIVFSGMKGAGFLDSLSLWRAPVEGGPATPLAVAEVGVGRRSNLADEWYGESLLISSQGILAVDPARAGSSKVLFPATGRVLGARAAAGRIVFASLPPFTQQLWSVAMDHNSGRVRGAVEPLLHASGSQSMPATSFDGSKLLFTHEEPTRSELRLRDMASSTETVLHAASVRGKISPDGSKVAFGDYRSVWLMDASGGEATKVVEHLHGSIYGWTADGHSLVYHLLGPTRWFTLDVASHKSDPLLAHPKLTIHGVELSPDRRWISFHIPGGVREPVYIAPVRDGTVAGESEWIRAADTAGRNSRPWWSPDGNLLYWISERDGFVCAWAQRLEPATKKAKGEPFAVLHFHEARRSLAAFGLASFGPAISRDRLTFALPESSGNIWIAEKEAAK